MKKVVVYQSSTGFTKQYAEWIAQELNCNVYSIKEVSKAVIDDSDEVIYGGWIMGNMIMGLDKIRKMSPKKLTVFAVGSMPPSEQVEKTIIEQNSLGDLVFQYFQGGFHYDKLSLPIRLMLKAVKGAAAKKESKTEQDKYMENVIGTSFDASDRSMVSSLLEKIANS